MPLKFIWGEEDYLIENAINKIKSEVLKGEITNLNYKTYDSPDFALFNELLRTNAMMFGDIVIVIKCQNYFLSVKNKIELDDKQIKQLTEALNNISDKVHIILVCPIPRGEKKKPDSRKKLYKEIQKITKIEEFPAYKNYEEYKLKPIIKTYAKELGLNITDSECTYLMHTTGVFLRDIHTQLEKIKLLIHPDTKVTQKSINEIATQNVDIFTIVDDILSKEYSKAINKISNIIEKEHYLPSLMLIQTMINNLLKTKILSKSLNSYEISVRTGQSKYVTDKNLEKIANVSTEELVRLKTNLTTVEYMLKSGKITDPIMGYELALLSNNLEDKID